MDSGFRSPVRKAVVPKWIRTVLIIFMAYVMSSAAFSMLAPCLLFKRSDGTQPRAYTYAEIADSRRREEFPFMSGKNMLQGYFYPADDPRGTLILVNGMNANGDSHIPEIMYFLDSGWSVLTFDATGIGMSQGLGCMGLQQPRLDLLALLGSDGARQYLRDPVVIYGHSAGGYAAASILDLGYDIKGAVCISAFDSPVDTMMRYGSGYAGILAYTQYPFILAEARFFFGDSADVRASESVLASDIPVLVIHGESDDVVDLGISLYSALLGKPAAGVHLLLVDEEYRAEHSTAWNTAEAGKYLSEGREVTDKSAANELDAQFMEFILAFYDSCIKQP